MGTWLKVCGNKAADHWEERADILLAVSENKYAQSTTSLSHKRKL
jgi:hypothetical protein